MSRRSFVALVVCVALGASLSPDESRAQSFQSLGDLGGDPSVSDDGSAVVGTGDMGSGDEAVRWTVDGGLVGLGRLPGGGGTYAKAISADGAVVRGGGAQVRRAHG